MVWLVNSMQMGGICGAIDAIKERRRKEKNRSIHASFANEFIDAYIIFATHTNMKSFLAAMNTVDG